MVTLHPHIHPESATVCTKLQMMETEKRSLSSWIRIDTNTFVCKQFPSYYIITLLTETNETTCNYNSHSNSRHTYTNRVWSRHSHLYNTFPVPPPPSIQSYSGHAGITPWGFQRFLPRVPTLRVWAAPTQPLSWEGIEKFSEFRGNHQSTKEEGIPYTFSLTQVHRHTLAHAFKATITRRYKLQKPLTESCSQILKCNSNIMRPLAPPRCISRMPTDTHTCMQTKCQTQR